MNDWKERLDEALALGVTQVRLAELSGLSQATISDLATGRTTDPKASTVLALLDAIEQSYEVAKP